MVGSRQLKQTTVGFTTVIVASVGIGFLFAALLLRGQQDRSIDHPSPISGPSVTSAASPSATGSAEELGLTHTFVNKKFGYSFRYPDAFTVLAYNTDRTVVLRKGGSSVLTFAITTLAEERALLKQVEKNALVLTNVQDHFLQKTGNGQSRGYPGSQLGFQTLKTNGAAIGFTLTNLPHFIQELDGEDTSFLHLRGGHVLVIRQHRSEILRADPALVTAIVKGVNPFVRE